jgi:hypothetical protein
MIELNAAEGKPYTEAAITASNKDGGWVHIVYVPISAADRATYPAKSFIDRRAGIQDAEKRIGTIKHFLNERGQSVECVAYAAAHQGMLIGGNNLPKYIEVVADGITAPNLVTPDVDGEPVVGESLEEAGINPADFVTVGKVVVGIDVANGEDYTAPLPVAPYVPKKKRGSGDE